MTEERTDDLRPQREKYTTADLGQKLGAMVLRWLPVVGTLLGLATGYAVGNYRLAEAEKAIEAVQTKLEKLSDEVADKASGARIDEIRDKLTAVQQDVAVIKVTIERRR